MHIVLFFFRMLIKERSLACHKYTNHLASLLAIEKMHIKYIYSPSPQPTSITHTSLTSLATPP